MKPYLSQSYAFSLSLDTKLTLLSISEFFIHRLDLYLGYVPWKILRGADFEKHFLPTSGPRVKIHLYLETHRNTYNDSYKNKCS